MSNQAFAAYINPTNHAGGGGQEAVAQNLDEGGLWQHQLAKSIYRDHLLCAGAISAMLVVELAFA